MKTIPIVLLILFGLTGLQTKAQDFSKYDKGSYIKDKDSIYYRILFPENFDAKQKYPVLFFLHGSGERGSDNQKQLAHGGSLFLNKDNRKKFPAIVIFPQCPENDRWANVRFIDGKTGKERFIFTKGGKPTKIMHALLAMIDNILDKPYADKNQVYIGGLSMGGMGTFELLRRQPKTFAAAFSICGADTIANVNKYKKVPIWIFHGGKDDVVPPDFSKEIADHLKIIGREVKYTLYADANHNSWDPAFAEPQLLPWLFSHRKN
eukprot:gene12691-14900_t